MTQPGRYVHPDVQRSAVRGFEERRIRVPPGSFIATDRFGRMPPSLKPLTSIKPGPAELGQFWGAPAPLWFYVSREAEVKTAGMRLAGAGAALGAQTFLTLLSADLANQINREPDWKHLLYKCSGSGFSMTDLVAFTGGDNLPSEDANNLPGE